MSKGTLSFIFVIVLVLLAPEFLPQSYFQSHLSQALQMPSLLHPLGTEGHGKDILGLILKGLRLSLLISFLVVSFCLTLGVTFGFLAGYFGGWTDKTFIFIADIFQAFPGILLAIAFAAFIPPSFFNLVLLLSFVGWVSYARVVRAQTIELKSKEYIQATKAMGLSLPKTLFHHFIPNMAGPLIVQASFGMAGVILVESTLSFLGLGLPANVASLGKLIDSGVNLLLVAPHVALFPGAMIMIIVLIFNFLGERLRKRLV